MARPSSLKMMGQESGHLMTPEEASVFLGVSSEELERLVQGGQLSAYRVGGVFLRFRREQLEYIKEARSASPVDSPWHRILDFLYFNDFYLLAVGAIAALLWVILRA